MCEGSKHSVGASESSTVVEICDNSRYWAEASHSSTSVDVYGDSRCWAGSDCWPKADMSNGSENWNGVGMRITLEYLAEVAMKAASGY
jgi:hypothetical protein